MQACCSSNLQNACKHVCWDISLCNLNIVCVCYSHGICLILCIILRCIWALKNVVSCWLLLFLCLWQNVFNSLNWWQFVQLFFFFCLHCSRSWCTCLWLSIKFISVAKVYHQQWHMFNLFKQKTKKEKKIFKFKCFIVVVVVIISYNL